MSAYRCTNCGHVLAPGESPCSQCGDIRRTVDKLIETETKLNVSVQMTVTKTIEEIRKNWLLIVRLQVGHVHLDNSRVLAQRVGKRSRHIALYRVLDVDGLLCNHKGRQNYY